MLSLSLNTPPQPQLEVLLVLPKHRSDSSWLHASLARSSTYSIPRASRLPVGLSARTALLSSLVVAVLELLVLPSLPLGPRLIQRIQIKHPNRLGFLRSIFALVRVGCFQLVFRLLTFDGFIFPMLGWLRLFLSVAPLMSAFGLFRESALGFFSRSKIQYVIRLGVTVSSAPLLLPSMVFQDFSQGLSPPQVRHVEMSQPKCTRDLPQLVQTKAFGKDVGVLRSVGTY